MGRLFFCPVESALQRAEPAAYGDFIPTLGESKARQVNSIAPNLAGM
jgi:hypothetical protein